MIKIQTAGEVVLRLERLACAERYLKQAEEISSAAFEFYANEEIIIPDGIRKQSMYKKISIDRDIVADILSLVCRHEQCCLNKLNCLAVQEAAGAILVERERTDEHEHDDKACVHAINGVCICPAGDCVWRGKVCTGYISGLDSCGYHKTAVEEGASCG